jgi:type IV fimbrial biogenesis protein FimT
MNSTVSNHVPQARLDRRRSRGLTLIELMVGVAILAIVLAVAAPEFRNWGRNTRTATQAADLQTAMSYARSESSRRGVRITLCASSSTTATTPTCNGDAAKWGDGWLIFVDNTQTGGNAIGVLDGADTLLRIGEPTSGSAVATTGNVGAWLSFSPQGLVRTTAGTANGGYTICQKPHQRRLAVSPVGLVTLSIESCS